MKKFIIALLLIPSIALAGFSGGSGGVPTNAIIPLLNTAPGVTTITSAGGITTLTAASTMYQRIIGTANQTITLPDQTTIPAGTAYVIDSDTTGIVTVKDSAGTTLATGLNGNAGYIYSMSNATATGNWGGYAFVPAGMTFPTTAATLARTDAGQTFTGDQVVTGKITSTAGVVSTSGRFTGGIVTSPGQGAEIGYASGSVQWQAYDRTAGAYVQATYPAAAHYFNVGTTGSAANIVTISASGASVTGTLSSTAAAKLSSGSTVAGLATCNAAYIGYRAYVTDALAPAFLGVLTGGGTVVTPVFCNGTAWVAH